MIDCTELARGLEGIGERGVRIEQAFAACYGEHADLRYERTRYSEALSKFTSTFPNAKRVSVVRAPGRVNLIGEHTDYNGLPVLPMAIDRDMVIVFAPRRDRRVNLVNVSSWYSDRSFDIAGKIRPYSPGNWGNYAKAAAQALQCISPRPILGMDACVTGDIPSGSGLSSSSALTVAVAVALAAANGLEIETLELAELLARGERYVGTEGGGMDQAVSLLAEQGKALKLDFFPLAATPVELPLDHSFVVCNSMVAAEKSAAARDEYNRRVVECRLGALMLGRILGAEDVKRLGDLKVRTTQKRAEAVDQLPDGGLTTKEIAGIVGIPASRLKENVLRLANGDLAQEPKDGFRVKQRVRHVLSEGARVERAALAMSNGDVKQFGNLMNESHESCALDYEISTPELDELVRICREEGALGARLTGAGFGGCAIALVPDSDLPDFISSVISRYYHEYLPSARHASPTSTMALEEAIFPCKPCAGAGKII